MTAWDNNLISLVMRTVGGRRRETQRALQSVAASTYRPIELVIVYQGSDPDELDFLTQLSDAHQGSLSVRVLQNAGTGDLRAQNLNIGWRESRGRYLGFLDDDDTLEPNHCQTLLDAIQRSGRAWAYGQVVLRKEGTDLQVMEESRPFVRHRFCVIDLWTDNFIPIHSFLVDRARLVPELQEAPFCELLDRSEDWDFLIRLGFFHEPEMVDEVTCNYYVSLGDRNTNLSLMDGAHAERQEANRRAWARCKELVESRKSELLRRVWWAQGMFARAITPANKELKPESGELAAMPAPVSPELLRRRIVRAIIRRLERLL